jgi:hypothetical protein
MGVRLDSSFSTSGIDFGAPSHLEDLDPLAVSAWIYPLGWGQSSYGRILCKEGVSTGWMFFVDDNASNETLAFYRYRETGNANYRAVDYSITLNQWQHVAAVYTSTFGKLYINGESVSLQTSVAGSGSNVSDSGTNLIAGNRSGYSRGFFGRLSGLQIFNRELSDSEIGQIYYARGHDRVYDKLFDAPLNEGVPQTTTGTDANMKDRTNYLVTGSSIYASSYWTFNVLAPRRRG